MALKTADWPAPWSVLQSSVAYDGQWWRLRTDRCRTGEGAIVERYPVLEYPAWISVVAFRRKDCKLLLTYEYRHGIGKVMAGLPGGTVEPGEMALGDAGLARAAWRELLEETGYGGGKLLPLLSASPNPATHNNTVTSYLAYDVQRLTKPSEDGNGEAIGVAFHDFPALLHEIQSGQMFMDATQIAAIFSAALSIVQDRVQELRSLADATRSILMRPRAS